MTDPTWTPPSASMDPAASGDFREFQEVAEATEIRPGDTLIVRVRRPIPAVQAAHMKAHFEANLPGVRVLLVVADGMAVYRPSEGG